MSDEFGPDFVTITDENGNDIELEFLDAMELDGVQYMAFYPAQSEESSSEEEEEDGIILLKIVVEDGEELLSTLDSNEEMERVYDQFMERIFSEEDEED